MRTDYFQNMQRIHRQERIRNYRNKIIFYLGIAVFAYLGVVLSITIFKRNDSVISGQAAVTKYEGETIKQTNIPSATATATSNSSAKAAAVPTYRPSSRAIHAAAPSPSGSPVPQYTWRSTGSGGTVYTTSSATVKNIGGGGGSAGGGSHSGSGSSSAFCR